MIVIEKSVKNMEGSVSSLCLLTTLVLGGTYLLYATKPLPTTYEYEDDLREATKNVHIAKLTISPKIGYGGTGKHSLRKITHTLELLSESKTNKGLVIDCLVPYGKKTEEETFRFVQCTILKDALQDYQKKTKRKIIVHLQGGLDKFVLPLLLILSVADKIILETTNIFNKNHLADIQARYKQLKEKVATGVDLLTRKRNVIYSGKYKVINDRNEDEKINNEYHNAIEDAISTLEKNISRLPDSAEQQQPKGNPSLSIDLDDYIKREIEQVPIINLQECIDKYTPAYTPQQRNVHRRTEACFETIMISGDIDDSLVTKMSPLIQSVHCDPNIKGVIIVWDSLGGKQLSIPDLLDLLKKLDSAKPVIHVAGERCTSGAYVLAAATGVRLAAYSKAILGSIGVVLEIDNIASNIEEIRKDLDKDRKWLVQIISQNRAKLVDVNRNAYGQKLWETEARTYTASRAKEAQLIDEIGTLQNAIEALKDYTGLNLPVYYSENETQPISA